MELTQIRNDKEKNLYRAWARVKGTDINYTLIDIEKYSYSAALAWFEKRCELDSKIWKVIDINQN